MSTEKKKEKKRKKEINYIKKKATAGIKEYFDSFLKVPVSII